ncbi:MAG: ABC transporter permease [Alphaproteobacteria bacterium]|nr:ABC transporter permease [Alphaproteobacteria bacterium]
MAAPATFDAGRLAPERALALGPVALLRRRIFGHRSLMLGIVVLGLMLAMGLLAYFIAPHDPYAQSLASRRFPPIWHAWIWDDPKAGWNNVLGTDKVGRDYLSRLIYGARISLLIGFATMVISGLIGTTLGVLAGYFGGRVDMVVTFLVTTRLSMPVVLVALAVVALFGSSLEMVILVLGFLLWDRFAVVMRSVTMQARDLDYVTAARAIGCSTPYIIVREIMPNIVNSLVVVATVEMANAILLEAALSFLGLGVQPPLPSWGLMLSEAKEDMFFSPWMITLPGICLFMLVLSINLLGDGVRDVTAPEGRN